MRLFCHFDTIAKVFVDGGYTGTLIEWAEQMFGYTVEVVKRTEQHLFKVLPKRWIVERTFGWFFKSRRLCRDYEVRIDHSEAMLRICMIRLMVKRLASI